LLSHHLLSTITETKSARTSRRVPGTHTALRHDNVDASLLRLFERDVLPAWCDAGAPPCAVYVTEPAEHDFPGCRCVL